MTRDMVKESNKATSYHFKPNYSDNELNDHIERHHRLRSKKQNFLRDTLAHPYWVHTPVPGTHVPLSGTTISKQYTAFV